MRQLVLAVALASIGCGRLGFGNDGEGDDGPSGSFVPSNGAVFPSGVVLEPLVLTVDATLSTDDGSIVNSVSGQVLRPGGDGLHAGVWLELRTDAAVFAVAALDVRRSLDVRGARSAIVLVEGRAAIDGVIRLRGGDGDVIAAGPGGGRGGTNASAPATGCGPGRAGLASDVVITGADSDGGGAGGAFGTAGGGGSPHPMSGTDTPPCGEPTLEPLIGGGGGAAGGVFEDLLIGGRGGGGGGAIQISAAEIGLAGTIDAGGGGGENGRTGPPQFATDWGGGGGGGAGGAILLEAPAVAFTGTLAANGGGGGGDVGSGTAERGTTSAQPATGGQGVIPGGAGCSVSSAPRPGSIVVNGRDAAGGGGGCGRIRINADELVSSGIGSPTPIAGALRR